MFPWQASIVGDQFARRYGDRALYAVLFAKDEGAVRTAPLVFLTDKSQALIGVVEGCAGIEVTPPVKRILLRGD